MCLYILKEARQNIRRNASLTKGYSVLDYACYRAGNGFARTEEVVLFLEAKKPALPLYGAPCSLGARIIGVH